ncbi:immunoglobulin lambda-1 light chain-like, partial [Micropterus dolomieu]|uniref:immunoglobulin lambda-1 light chain-like n=1 Tax=Micropterus dolomieu TaxID=147949 RepID=UPI001E8EF451
FIFGSGTKLYVTDHPVVKPVVSVYPAASRKGQEEKSSLMCVAADMFPPPIRFSWKRIKDNGLQEELAPGEEEQREFRQLGCIAAIRVIDEDARNAYNYRCYVQHEGGEVEAKIKQEVSAKTSPPPSLPPSRPPSLPPSRPPSLPPSTIPSLPPSIEPSLPPSMSFQSQCRVKLLCLMYTVLIVKSLVYCCGLSLLRILRNKGPSTCCTHAD